MISLKNLNKYFNRGRQNQIHVINDVTLDLPEKGMVAIFGPSGCGKTTLLNVIGGLDSFAGGSVSIDGNNVRRNTDVIRNRYVGYIFQNYNLNNSESCFDNVANALRLCGIKDEKVIESRVMAALGNVDMANYRKRTPDTLSGGQQQRIAIARAIVKNPKIILADEPTGNLDEANTVMIMDLLKAISRDHLVLLVTHEAELVDYYCDKVIELRDGKIVGTKTNEEAEGLAIRDKNAIYLGELKKTEINDKNTVIDYYGDQPAAPVKLTVVNNGGKLYVRLDTRGVQVLDDFSEIKLVEGVFEKKAARDRAQSSIDMSDLPPVSGAKFGRLFSLWSSVKSGYTANFKNRHKGKKLLRVCMCLFAAVLVLMSAVFGTAFDTLLTAGKAYNHNVFYAYTPDGQVSDTILSALGDEDSGIDYVGLYYGEPTGDKKIAFSPGSFETFSTSIFSSELSTNAVYMTTSAAEGLELLAGRNKELALWEILISSQVADALIKNTSLGYLEDYSDVVGLICSTLAIGSRAAVVAGVVEAREPAIYMSPIALAKIVNNNSHLRIAIASEFGFTVQDGEAVFMSINPLYEDIADLREGDTVKIQGRDIHISRIVHSCDNYEDWLKANCKDEYITMGEYIDSLKSQYPDMSEDQLHNQYYFDFLETYYSQLDNYLSERFLVNADIYAWLYLEKGITDAKYLMMNEGKLMRAADKYKEAMGSYPTLEEIMGSVEFDGEDLQYIVDNYVYAYESEFYSISRPSLYETTYLVSEKDYIDFSVFVGETHESASSVKYIYNDSFSFEDLFFGSSSATVTADKQIYTLIHSTNPALTSRWIKQNLSGVTAPEDMPAVVKPSTVFGKIIADSLRSIVVSSVTLGVVMVILSVCMYFIMRSSLMNRIKEIGIYRAIGVSRKNLIFKFGVESAVLTTLTVFLGYLISGIFVVACIGVSPLVESVFFFPIWYALILLVFLYAVCIILGTLPIIMLLRKTPSQILAKYDI